MELRGPYRQILSTILSVAAAAIAVRGIAHPTPIDQALPLLALAASLLAAVSTLRLIELAPLFLVAAAFVPSDPVRLLAYGIVVSIAFVAAVVANTIDDEISIDRALAMLIVLVVVRFAVPVSIGAEIAVVVGCVALLFVASGDLAIRDTAFLLVVATGVVAPSAPFRSALFPLVAAALVAAIRRRGWIAIVVLVAIAIVAGRWGWPFAIAGIVYVAVNRFRVRSASPMLPMIVGRPLALGATAHAALFDPAVVVRFSDALAPALASLVLVASALASRPQLAAEYVVTALLLTACESKHRGLVIVPLFFTAAGIALIAWSGTVSSVFPLPLPLVSIAALAALVSIPALPSRFALALTAVVALAVLVIARPVGGEWRPVHREVVPSATLTSDRTISAVSVSGANLTPFGEGTVVGRLQLLDRRGRGFERDIRVGDVADWAAFEPAQRFWNHNPLPYSFSGTFSGWGLQSWPVSVSSLHVEVDDVVGLRVVPDPRLPKNAQLTVEGIEVRTR